MVTTIPNTEELIPDEVLNELSLGTLQALQLRLAQRQHEKILEPTAYENFARHSLDTGIDWGTQWAAAPPGPSVAPIVRTPPRPSRLLRRASMLDRRPRRQTITTIRCPV